MRKLFGFFGRAAAILAGVYALLFVIFYFDLDGKLLFRKVEPWLVKHYDKMERRDPLSVAYDVDRR